MFSKSKIAVFSDLHMGVHGNSSMWHDISLNWVKWFANSLEKNGIKDIVFTGDWFHNRDEIAVNTIHMAGRVLEHLKGFNIHIIVGNHDSFHKDNSLVNSLDILDNDDNIRVYPTSHEFESFGKKILFCSWGVKYDDIPNKDIIFGHFEIKSFKFNAFSICKTGYNPKQLLNKAPLVISGHLHLQEERKYNEGNILYIGNPFQMDFGDIDSDKGYYIIDIETLTPKFIKNTVSPRFVKVKYSNYKDCNNLKGNIAKLIVDQDVSEKEINTCISNLHLQQPLQLTIDYLDNVRSNNNIDNEKFEGVDMEVAITEFINNLQLEEKDKKQVIEYTISLYKKIK